METNEGNERKGKQLRFKKAWLPGLLLLLIVVMVVLYYLFCTPQSSAQEDSDTKPTDTVYVKHVVFVDTVYVEHVVCVDTLKVTPVTVPVSSK